MKKKFNRSYKIKPAAYGVNRAARRAETPAFPRNIKNPMILWQLVFLFAIMSMFMSCDNASRATGPIEPPDPDKQNVNLPVFRQSVEDSGIISTIQNVQYNLGKETTDRVILMVTENGGWSAVTAYEMAGLTSNFRVIFDINQNRIFGSGTLNPAGITPADSTYLATRGFNVRPGGTTPPEKHDVDLAIARQNMENSSINATRQTVQYNLGKETTDRVFLVVNEHGGWDIITAAEMAVLTANFRTVFDINPARVLGRGTLGPAGITPADSTYLAGRGFDVRPVGTKPPEKQDVDMPIVRQNMENAAIGTTIQTVQYNLGKPTTDKVFLIVDANGGWNTVTAIEMTGLTANFRQVFNIDQNRVAGRGTINPQAITPADSTYLAGRGFDVRPVGVKPPGNNMELPFAMTDLFGTNLVQFRELIQFTLVSNPAIDTLFVVAQGDYGAQGRMAMALITPRIISFQDLGIVYGKGIIDPMSIFVADRDALQAMLFDVRAQNVYD